MGSQLKTRMRIGTGARSPCYKVLSWPGFNPSDVGLSGVGNGDSRDVPKVFERHLGPPCRSRSGLLQGALDQSRANASIGSSRAALRAGTKPKTIPISVEQMKAVTIEFTENTIFHSFTSSENT